MKKIMKYMLLSLLAWGGTACSKDPAADATGEGSVRFDISMTQMTRSGETPDNVAIRIYRADGALIRRYTALDELPSPLYLTAGDYSIRIEAGDPEANAAFLYTTDEERLAKLYFFAEEPFSVTAHETLTQEIVVPAQNVGATTRFDPDAEGTENAKLSDVAIDVAAMTLADAASATSEAYDAAAADAPKLRFGTGTQTGYFLCPEGVTSLVWRFSATHSESGDLLKIGSIDNVEAGKLYKLTFNYSTLPDGLLGISVSVDESVETQNDQIIFKPQPELTGVGFDLAETQPYQEGSTVTFTCTGIVDLSSIVLDGVTLYEDGAVQEGAAAGVTLTRVSGTEVTIALDADWFAARETGFGSALFRIDSEYAYTYNYAKQGLIAAATADCDLWANTAALKAVVTDASAADVRIRYRRQGAAEWAEAAAVKGSDGYTWTAATAAAWSEGTNANGHTVYTPDPDHAIFAENTYEYQLLIDGSTYGETAQFTPTTSQTIDGNFEDSGLSCWTTSNSSASYWGSGNNTKLTLYGTDALCTQSSYTGQTGAACAKLQACAPLSMLASGNIFTGTFTIGSTDGTVAFGIPYDWQARPASLKLKYHASIGTVNCTKYASKIASGDADQASIYVCIVDWTTRHEVTSGYNSPEGVWSPEEGNNPTDSDGNAVGTIIGYGTYYPQGTTEGDAMVELEIPIYYYDKTTKPSANYTLVIACSTSRYGDWMNGSSKNTMYVDDFRWGY